MMQTNKTFFGTTKTMWATGYRVPLQDAGYRMQPADYMLQAPGYRLQIAG